MTDYTDRTTCILFGDGAGVALLEQAKVSESQWIQGGYGTHGEAGIHLYRSGLSTTWRGEALNSTGNIVQNGREVYRLVVSTLAEEIPQFLESYGYTLEDIDWFIPHSANFRMIEALCNQINLDTKRILFSGTQFGNTSAATIPIAWADAVEKGQIQKGDLLLLTGFGAGFTYSHCLLRW